MFNHSEWNFKANVLFLANTPNPEQGEHRLE